MKALLLCDRESVNFEGVNLSERLQATLQNIGCEVQTVVVSDDEIRPCLGCFGCWLKTPGLCVITNDCANDISGCEIRSDFVVLVSRITYGGYSSDLKAFLDRSIPNILPLFEIYEGEMHHKMRYERFPGWIAVGYGEATQRERQTFMELAKRNALNMRPPMYFVFTAQAKNEIDGLLSSMKSALESAVHI